MKSSALLSLTSAEPEVMDALKVIKTEEEYEKALSLMDGLFDYSGIFIYRFQLDNLVRPQA